VSFASLKNKKLDTQKLINEISKLGGGSKKRVEDDRFWKPQVDKLGNGYAVIRFLPSKTEEDLTVPFVTTWDHGFQGPTGLWYIENSLSTIGRDDPVGVLNSSLWNSGLESNKEIARKQKRRLHYIGNILVIKDSANPANEGKVFLYKFGAKIYSKIKDAMSPPEGFEDETPIIPYDFWEGANFKLKIRRVEGYPNYDSSSFDTPSALFDGDDAKIESVYNQLNLLKPFVSPDGKDADGNPYFKSYEELKAKLDKVLGTAENFNTRSRDPEPEATYSRTEKFESTTDSSDDDSDVPWDTDSSDESSDGESDLDYFRKLASE
jgi:hypothetical protein